LKRKIFSVVTAIVLVVCIGFLLYRGYQWWQMQQKRKALFVYFQTKSPVTQKIPEDAFLYMNLFDFKRVHGGLQETKLYEVLSHWLDTGMAENHKANPLVGGMLETTILNVIGEEIALSLVPSGNKTPDLFVVAKLAPGSDFLIQLALSNSKNVRKIPFEEESIYGLQTKLADHPEIFIHVDEPFAYASSSETRIKKVHKPGKGPEFLAQLDVEPIPEDTFLFVQSKDPSFSSILHGGRHTYHLKASSSAHIPSHLPQWNGKNEAVIQFQTNGTEILKQPAASYALYSINDEPASSLFLSFPSKDNATRYQQNALQELQIPADLLMPITMDGLPCFQYSSGGKDRFICKENQNLLLAQNEPAVKQARSSLKRIQRTSLPLTLKVDFQPAQISHYLKKVVNQDWDRFPNAKEFYFLSCVKQIQGGIDGSQNEIVAEIL
jgi:hypothetical protein